MNKKYLPLFFFIPVVLVLWNMLLPGFVLTLDMAWTPDLPLEWSSDGFNNSYLIQALLHALSLVIPSWLVQKIMLVSLFFLLFYLPWRYLPWIKNETARVFASFIFVLNPFVYSRMLAGQWMVLFGYALLPLLLHTLMSLTENPNRKSALTFSGTLVLISLFSIHFLYISLIFSLFWIVALTFRHYDFKTLRLYLLSTFTFVLFSLYWLAPALTREVPLEARFNAEHFEVFGASSNEPLGVMANVAVLGGFWGEDVGWKYYFVWPQAHILFMIAAVLILSLVCFGIYRGIRNPETRYITYVLIVIGVLAYITALGAGNSPFKGLNLFLYEHVPLWNGLRDSQKIVGVLGLLYALFAGFGIEFLFTKLSNRMKDFIGIAVFCLPVLFGMYMWGGFHGQLNPVWYPNDWYKVKEILKNKSDDEKILVIPWHGYLSLDFASQRIVSNPTPTFFGKERLLASRSVEFGDVYDQEIDPKYRLLDYVIKNFETLSDEESFDEFKKNRIEYLIIIKNKASQSNLILQPKIASSSYFPLTLFESDTIVLKSAH